VALSGMREHHAVSAVRQRSLDRLCDVGLEQEQDPHGNGRCYLRFSLPGNASESQEVRVTR
jgi:hypothetical protein